jgi:hypothetical protein
MLELAFQTKNSEIAIRLSLYNLGFALPIVPLDRHRRSAFKNISGCKYPTWSNEKAGATHWK